MLRCRTTQRLVYLRGLISQLRTHSIPLDYGRVARDLRRLDDRGFAPRLLLDWGRDYHRGLGPCSRGVWRAGSLDETPSNSRPREWSARSNRRRAGAATHRPRRRRARRACVRCAH
ncbi:type I-E CRISPR-associated protein Cse2/CasB [Nocardia sp. NBC_00881]|uniref:type I-E CRISPR-associated protein Cse2/CasB n=1 Tax=Nocardia sp. NBC_00881 TaxID=2975995 RepID=UPI003864EEE4